MLQERHPDIKASRHLKLIVGEREHWEVLKEKFAESAEIWGEKYRLLQNTEKTKCPLQNKTLDEGSVKILYFTVLLCILPLPRFFPPSCKTQPEEFQGWLTWSGGRCSHPWQGLGAGWALGSLQPKPFSESAGCFILCLAFVYLPGIVW